MHRRLHTERRSRLALLAFLALTALGDGAVAQQLFTFSDPPEGPASVRASSRFGPDTAPAADIVVDVDLLRSSPQAVLMPQHGAAPRAVYLRDYEYRGRSDMMWSGGPGNSGYADAVFTVRAGWTVGVWHDDTGTQWQFWAGPDGKGKLTRSATSNAADWCGAHGPRAVDVEHPAAVSSAATGSFAAMKKRHQRIDLIIVITDLARQRWREWLEERWGYVSTKSDEELDAHIQSWVDYGDMVLGNHRSEIGGLRLRLTHIEDNGVAGEKATAVPRLRNALWTLGRFDEYKNRLHYLRRQHQGDVVFVITAGEFTALQSICGAANLYDRSQTIESMSWQAFGFVDLNCTFRKGLDLGYQVFIHELGHTMGANHPRELPHQPEQDARRAYGYGLYVNPGAEDRKDPTADNVPDGATGAATIMTYNRASYVAIPFFSDNSITLTDGQHGLTLGSSPDLKHKKWRIGVNNFADNARLLSHSAWDIAKLQDYIPRVCGAPVKPQITAVKDNGDGTITVDATWVDSCHDETGYYLQVVAYRPSDSQADDSWLIVVKGYDSPKLPPGSTSASVTWDHGGLEEGWKLGVDVLATNERGNTAAGTLWSPIPIRPLAPAIEAAVSAFDPEFAEVAVCDPVAMHVVAADSGYDHANRDPQTFHLTWTETDEDGGVSTERQTLTADEACADGWGFEKPVEAGHSYALSATSENKYGTSDAGTATFNGS